MTTVKRAKQSAVARENVYKGLLQLFRTQTMTITSGHSAVKMTTLLLKKTFFGIRPTFSPPIGGVVIVSSSQ